jgi:hypothetical protein
MIFYLFGCRKDSIKVFLFVQFLYQINNLELKGSSKIIVSY